MKLITAVLQPTVLHDVQIQLALHGIAGMTVSECSGYGRQRGHREVYRGTEFTIDFVTKTKLEILVADDAADAIIDVIIEAAHTGDVGDGKVWSTQVDDAVRIRTGERGDSAI